MMVKPKDAHKVFKAKDKEDGVQASFIDVRPLSVNKAWAEGFTRMPYSDLESTYTKVAQDKPLYIMDTTGFYSEKAARFFESKGYRDVNVIEGNVFVLPFFLTVKRGVGNDVPRSSICWADTIG